jgi:hypothetical protein
MDFKRDDARWASGFAVKAKGERAVVCEGNAELQEKSVPKPSIKTCRSLGVLGTLLGFADPTAWEC